MLDIEWNTTRIHRVKEIKFPYLMARAHSMLKILLTNKETDIGEFVILNMYCSEIRKGGGRGFERDSPKA